ncbi:MAG TPA: ABC transporter permease [Trueperaceae bacterium]|nr:ABC transporter permease [Trueperaceae bacterium]
MTAYLLRRLLGLVPVLVGVTLLIFFLTRVIPGDPATAMLGQRAAPNLVQRLRTDLGLDRPLFLNLPKARETGVWTDVLDSQYFSYMSGLLRLDLGRSIYTLIPIAESLRHRFAATFELTLAAMVFAVAVGLPAGVLAATRRGTFADTAIMLLALSGVSFPVFWLAIIMIYVFSVTLGWLPPSGRLSIGMSVDQVTGMYVLDSLLRGRLDVAIDAARHLVMPALALGTIPLAIVVRMTRSAMLDVLGQDYVRTARSKGLSERRVVRVHALRNALLPVVTVIGLSFGSLLSGALLTETVFSWPGIGRWVYDAIAARDYPVIQGGVLFVAVMFAVVNLLVDMTYALIDPRIQYS